MVKMAKAVRAAREFNQRRNITDKAIVRQGDLWDAEVTVTSQHGANFTAVTADLASELHANIKVEGDNLVLY